MPPRLSRRQQRELEELEELNTQSGQKERVDVVRTSPNQGIGFSALVVPGDDGTEEEGEEGEQEETRAGRKSKKKKKKSGKTETQIGSESPRVTQKSAPPSSSSPLPVRNEKKAAKKARAKKTKAESDELDQILAEMSLQYPSSHKTSKSVPGRPSLTDLLGVSLQFLNPEAEMRRFFGSKVVLATRTSESSSSPRGAPKKVQNVRSHLARPQPTWWPPQTRDGLSLRSYSELEVSEKLSRQKWLPIQEKWWTVEYSTKYKRMTSEFMGAVMAGDPQGLFNQLGKFPWHADTLLQIAEVYRHREEHTSVVDFIDRSLFAYERCLMGVFNFTTGLNRLDFDRVENRPFFLALHRQVADLQRRGCVRTSFEFARLLYGLDPWNDPHGAVFHLEYLAIKAGMYQWLLDMYDMFSDLDNGKDGRLNPCLLPGWAYARALALRLMEDATKEETRTKSVLALQQAVRDFPSVVPLLADKLDVDLPSDLRAHKDFKIETDNMSLSPAAAILHLLSHLYVQRCFPLWKEHASWFSKTVSEGFSALPRSLPRSEKREGFYALYEDGGDLCWSVHRHVVVLDFRRLFSFVPRGVFEGKSVACDPVPPPTSVSYYDEDFFRGVSDDTMGTRRVGTRQQQHIPDEILRQHLQEFFEAHPHLAERFPGGADQFGEMVAGLPPDLVGDLMVEAFLDGEGGNNMPGGLDEDGNAENVGGGGGGSDERVGEDGGESEDEDEEEVSVIPRVIRNLIGRVFGVDGAEESSSDEEGAPVDDMGVD